MTDEPLSIPDRIYFAIASLRGWESPLSLHQFHGPDQAFRVGRFISSVVLAGDDDREPLAVSGTADDNGTGSIIVVYPEFLVSAKVTNLDVNTGEFTITVHPLREAKDIRVETNHSYYNGTEKHPRYRGIEVTFTLGSEKLSLTPTQSSVFGDDTLVGSKAVHAAYAALRAAITGARNSE